MDAMSVDTGPGAQAAALAAAPAQPPLPPATETDAETDALAPPPPPPQRLSPAALALERAALERILRAFRGYRAALEAEVQRWERNLAALRDPNHRALLGESVAAKCAAARRAGDANQAFLDAMLEAFEEQGGVDGVLGLDQREDEDRETAGAATTTGGAATGAAGGAAVEPAAVGGDAHDCCGHDEHHHHHHHGDADTAAVSAEDVDKVRYVLKNVARDWSDEGAQERDASYGRIVAELRRCLLPKATDPGRRPAVLVPGAGLARLCVDVAAAGMRAQGNEFSYYMLVASAFILNASPAPYCRAVHPWAHATLNQLSDGGQVRPVRAPDALPQDLLALGGWAEQEERSGSEEGQGEGGEGAGGGGGGGGGERERERGCDGDGDGRPPLPPLSMCAGDFEEVYGAPGMRERFDAVATCFFIDTARNVVRYLEVIWHTLRPGGYWVHLGPLLWHWGGADPQTAAAGGGGGGSGDDEGSGGIGADGDVSIELSLEEVARVARAIGFRQMRSELVKAPYMGNAQSMLSTEYTAALWTMQKPPHPAPAPLVEGMAAWAAPAIPRGDDAASSPVTSSSPYDTEEEGHDGEGEDEEGGRGE